MKSARAPRYEQHFELGGFGFENQEKLLQSKIFVVGAGGLGCPALLYLAAAGVGNITIADDDFVSHQNLNRQIIYRTSDADLKKIEVAKKELSDLNPHVNINIILERITKENIGNYINDFDLIIDCTDNFDSRYVLNEFSYRNNITLLSGSVVYYSGQISIFKNGYACYQCLYPIKPNPHDTPACTLSGVLGPVAGTIGTMMATEAIKELTGLGNSIAGSIISYNAITSEIVKMGISRNHHCPICSS